MSIQVTNMRWKLQNLHAWHNDHPWILICSKRLHVTNQQINCLGRFISNNRLCVCPFYAIMLFSITQITMHHKYYFNVQIFVQISTAWKVLFWNVYLKNGLSTTYYVHRIIYIRNIILSIRSNTLYKKFLHKIYFQCFMW